MKFRKEVTVLAVLIMVLSLTAAITGIYSSGGPGKHEITSIRGETVEIYGKGLYRNDSVSMASQAIAQDVVTVLVGIPLLAASLASARKGRLKGKILLAGTLAYFLYTYASYSFTSMFNDLFLVDVGLMSLSFFAFLLAMMSLDPRILQQSFNAKLPVRTIAGFLIFIAAVIGLMWVGRIEPSFVGSAVPIGLEHYSTLVIQALDLGFVVPAAILSGLLLLQRRPLGLLLSSILCVKAVTMLTALTAMIIGQMVAGVSMEAAEIILFPAFNLAGIGILVLIFKHIQEPGAGAVT
jgi:hypothetical protein